MAANTQQAEGIKMISDWSKWIATVETGSIAVIGSIFSKIPLNPLATNFLSLTIISFILSILAAACVLVALPAALQDIEPNEKIWDRVAALLMFKPKLMHVVIVQFVLFTIGILLFGIGVILLLFCKV